MRKRLLQGRTQHRSGETRTRDLAISVRRSNHYIGYGAQ